MLICLAGSWTTTGEDKGERLLLHDTGVESDERIIIFATDDSLKYLASSEKWYVDGNFDLSPPLFAQLYVVRVKRNDFCVTAAYCLLQRKTEATYECMFRILLEECAQRNIYPEPKMFHIDFEKAAIKAIKSTYGCLITIRGCFYHLTQSTHRKLQKLGLAKKYNKCEDFAHFCSMVDATAFLPLAEVTNAIAYLSTLADDEDKNKIIDYFDSTYVTGRYRAIRSGSQRMSLRREPAKFPPEMWNMREATLHNSDRTNNETEGWNNRFKNIVGHSHPTIFYLIEKIRQEVAVGDTKVRQSELGRIATKKQRSYYENMQKKN